MWPLYKLLISKPVCQSNSARPRKAFHTQIHAWPAVRMKGLPLETWLGLQRPEHHLAPPGSLLSAAAPPLCSGKSPYLQGAFILFCRTTSLSKSPLWREPLKEGLEWEKMAGSLGAGPGDRGHESLSSVSSGSIQGLFSEYFSATNL